ncbi:ATP-binding protein [uncultured Thiodictyon sp.]|uniref:ATP-binding protein n=1 Tax=uncultured Thiodictyon sp. TaxID=1846217 RepID=UPI0025F4D94F|nr:ATP-binding protein [uncultured Thiodictyon sp.]
MRIDVDLTNCDREPIQYTGAIQPHGALLVVEEPALRIVQVSANSESYLGLAPAALLGQPLGVLLDDETVAALRARLVSQELAIRLQWLMSVQTRARPDPFHLFGNRADGVLLLEFERRDPAARAHAPDLYQEVHTTIERLQSAPSLRQFFDLAVTEIRALTGFDRVMAYRFDADSSGEVIAEAVGEGRESYLGLHYPAVDIPEPARRLFRLSWVRHLPDVDYVPVPLVPEHHPVSDAPVDLSYAFSRSVSVMYTGYLRNMGVQATLVTTLLKDGRLWGLISCMHHATPHYVPYETRVAVEFLAHMLSLLMGSKDSEEHAAYRLALSDTRRQLLAALLTTNAFHAALIDTQPNLLTALAADGVALFADGHLSCLGHTPSEPEIRALLDWLATHDALQFASHRLAQDYPPAAAFRAQASGLLAVRLAPGAPEGVCWFRREVVQSVHWAGNPHKPVEVDQTGGDVRLLPRTSFALWKESVAGQSRPWLDCEIEHAAEVRRGLVEFLIGHAEQLKRMNQALADSNLELDTFAYAASHDLKEPLRGIHTLAEFLEDDEGARLSEPGRQRLETIRRLTLRMGELIESLLQYSRVGRIDLVREAVDLNAVLAQTLEDLQPFLAAHHAQVQGLGSLPLLSCDRVRAGEILSNLITNACKYNDQPVKQVVVGSDQTRDPPVLFVRDNGIGIDAQHLIRIFQVFRRLHGRDEYGGGTGAGLTITKKAVERHGGAIWVESVPGQGSTFYFTLAPRP